MTLRQPTARPPLTNVYLVTGTASIFPVLYALLGKEPSGGFALFSIFAPPFAVVLWMQRYLKSEPFAHFHDAAWLLYLGWPLLIPYYAVRLEGRRGWRLALLLAGLMFTPETLAAVVGSFWGPSS